ncbi:MAG: glycosyltransferase family 2 protein [Actinomycetota bacterium]|nr:glycosyltransferase family 2 protein [Actinomycetota bacterium]
MLQALRGLRVGTLSERALERHQRANERTFLARARAGRDVCWTHDPTDDQPLVTVRIATYNRGPLIVERAIRSALAQTYSNLEVLVVGDHCDDATAAAVLSVTDARVRFVNLPARGLYPTDPKARWMVAGTEPMNAALYLARGHWIAPCDDDDEFEDDHVERLLNHALEHRLEHVWSRAAMLEDGRWRVTSGPPLRLGQISHGSVLYTAGLRFFKHSDTCWRIPEPGDWNLWRRMAAAGVRMGFLDHLTYYHH